MRVKLLNECTFVMVLAIVGMARPAFGEDQLLPLSGRDGGRSFLARCDAGHVLVGLDLRAGNDIDAVRPLCAQPLSPTTIGEVWGEVGIFGGKGGKPTQLRCPQETPVVIKMRLEGEYYMNGFDLYCGIVDANRPQPSQFPQAKFDAPFLSSANNDCGGNYDPCPLWRDLETCPDGLVGVGIHGRSGDRVDALGLICGTPPQFSKMGQVQETTSKEASKPKLADVGNTDLSAKQAPKINKLSPKLLANVSVPVQFKVTGEIAKKWKMLDGPNTLGNPISDENPVEDGVGRYADFLWGSIYWSPKAGAHAINGIYRDLWRYHNGPVGLLGYPIADMINNESVNKFEFGVIKHNGGDDFDIYRYATPKLSMSCKYNDKGQDKWQCRKTGN